MTPPALLAAPLSVNEPALMLMMPALVNVPITSATVMVAMPLTLIVAVSAAPGRAAQLQLVLFDQLPLAMSVQLAAKTGSTTPPRANAMDTASALRVGLYRLALDRPCRRTLL